MSSLPTKHSPKSMKEALEALRPAAVDAAVMARLRAPFGCELISDPARKVPGRWRIHDANDDAIASVSDREEGYARLIVEALNLHPRFAQPAMGSCVHVHGEVRDARPAITTSNDVGAPVTFSSPAKLEFTRDLRTRTLVLRAIARHAETLLEQATDMQLREAYEATSGGTDDVGTVEMQRMEQSFKNAYARLLELVTTFPRKGA